MYLSFKRLIDFVIAFNVLVVLCPILLLVTIWLHFANKGAGAFFTQERPGKNGKFPGNKIQDHDGRAGCGREPVAGCRPTD